MAKQDYSYEHLWQHPEKYKRLTRDDLCNNDAVVDLCEMILQGVREEMLDILDRLNHKPNSKSARADARNMNNYLESEELASMSFGGSLSLADTFKKKCPRGLFEE